MIPPHFQIHVLSRIDNGSLGLVNGSGQTQHILLKRGASLLTRNQQPTFQKIRFLITGFHMCVCFIRLYHNHSSIII
jgi:hypothetical protein